MMKKCSKCGELKLLDEFYNWKHDHRCKKCVSEDNEKYRKIHPKKAEAYQKKYRKTHLKERNEYDKKRYQKHKNKLKKDSRNYYENHKDEIREKAGNLSMYENKDCTSYLGIVIAERLVRCLFNDVKVMPNGNPKFDFICNRGKKIDVKSACITLGNNKYPQWGFRIDYNTATDFFILVAFDDRTYLNPLHMWMIPGHILNYKSGIKIFLSTIQKWDKWKMDINDAQLCCNEMKGEL